MAKSTRQPAWVGFDLGGTKMLAKVFDDAFKEKGTKRRKTKAHEGEKAGLQRMADTIQDALDEAGVSAEEIAGIGIGCPGPLDPDKGVLLDPPNLGWRNVPVKAKLTEIFDRPVFLANDVDAGVFGEYALGAARGARCVLGAFPGTGIGGGCVYEGSIVRGAHCSAMEIGHIQVLPNGPRCGCGRRGCVEALASRLTISAAAAAAAFRGDAPHLLEAAGMDLAEIRSGALAASVAAGDAAVEQIVRDAARWLGVAIGSAVNLLAPDIVVLGGGLVEAMPELYLEEVRDTARRHVMPSFEDVFKVVLAKLGDDASVAGAAAWARREVTGELP